MTKQKNKMNERQLVDALVKFLKKNEKSKVYVFVDRDAPGVRHTRSGWDFLAAKNGRVVFCEAKIKNAKLTDWQKYVQAENALAENSYVVLRFFGDEVCNENTGEILEIEKVSFEFLIAGEGKC